MILMLKCRIYVRTIQKKISKYKGKSVTYLTSSSFLPTVENAALVLSPAVFSAELAFIILIITLQTGEHLYLPSTQVVFTDRTDSIR